MIDHVVGCKKSLPDLDDTHCKTLVRLLCKYIFINQRDYMTVHFSAKVNPADLMYSIVQLINGNRILKVDCRMDLFDDHHKHRSLELIGYEDGQTKTAEPFRMRHAFRIDKKFIPLPQEIKLRKIANILALMLHREASFTDTIQSFLGYARRNGEDYVVSPVDVCVLDLR